MATSRFGWTICAALLFPALINAAPVPAPRPPQPLADDVVRAWEKGGAEAGWMSVSESGKIEFRRGKHGTAGEIPSFRLTTPVLDSLNEFPAPEQPFGLCLDRAVGPDLRPLARLKTLHTLDLSSWRQKKDARRGEGQGLDLTPLTELADLRNLSLSSAQLRDEDLKPLRLLPRLRVLDLGINDISPKSLEPLAVLTDLQALCLGTTGVGDGGTSPAWRTCASSTCATHC